MTSNQGPSKESNPSRFSLESLEERLCDLLGFKNPLSSLSFSTGGSDSPVSSNKQAQELFSGFTFSTARKKDKEGDSPSPKSKSSSRKEKESSLEARVKEALKELKFPGAVLQKLTFDSQKELLTFMANGNLQCELAVRTVTAVSEAKHGNRAVNDWVERLVHYPSHLYMLKNILDGLGCDDVIALQGNIEVEKVSAHGGVFGVSGVKHSDVAWKISFENYGTVHAVHIGEQGLLPFLTALKDGRYSERLLSSRKEAKHDLVKEILKEIRLDELEENPGVKEKFSEFPLLSRRLKVYEDLCEVAKNFRSEFQGILTADLKQELEDVLNRTSVGGDPGGTLKTWFEEHLAAHPEAPAGVREAFELYFDSFTVLSPDELRYLASHLVAYQRLHQSIGIEAAFGNVIADFETFKEMDSEARSRLGIDEEALYSGFEELCHSIQGRESVPLSEFLKLIALSPFSDFRRTVCSRVLEILEPSVQNALQWFEPLVFADGKVREYVKGASVPMGYFREGVYALPFAEDRYSKKKQAVLTQPELRSVILLSKLSKATRGGVSGLLESFSSKEFQTHLTNLVVSYRKALYLEQKLTEFEAKNAAVNREHVGDALKNWQEPLFCGSGYTGEEELLLRALSKDEPARPIGELFEIAESRRIERESGDLPYSWAEEPLRVGLFPSKFLKDIKPMAERWQNCSRVSYDSELVKNFFEALDNPLFFNFSLQGDFVHSKDFLRKANFWKENEWEHARLLVGEYLRIKNEIALPEDKEFRHRLERIVAEIHRQHSVLVCNASVRSVGQKKQFVYSEAPLLDVLGLVALHDKLFLRTSYYLPLAAAKKLVGQAESGNLLLGESEEYVKKSNLPEDFYCHLTTLCSRDGKEILDEKGYVLVDRETFLAVRNIRYRGVGYFSREFVEEIERVWSED